MNFNSGTLAKMYYLFGNQIITELQKTFKLFNKNGKQENH